MRASRIAAVGAALALAAAMSVVPLQVTGAQSPRTSVLVPSSGATLSGSTYLDASASNATSVEFLLFGGTHGHNGPVICTATLTYYGWLCSWNTSTVPNGSYVLLSQAFGERESTFSSGVSITVNNSPPTTSVLIPSNEATLSGSTFLDASASNATSVEFRLFGGVYGYRGQVICTATLTYYGWLCSWNTSTVPIGSYALVSEASNTNGSSFSAGVRVTVYQETNYYAPSIDAPAGIAVGPDGTLWFTNYFGNSIGRITTAGVVSNYTDPSIDQPAGIAVGPDGALWFINEGTESESAPIDASIGRITTAGVVSNYTDPTISSPDEITAGPDGALWFTNGNSIGRISTAGVVTNYTDPSIDITAGITAGPDGALWFTNFEYNSIGRITTSGVVTKFTDPSIDNPLSITGGPDGALWFTNSGNNSIGRITTYGVVTNYTDPSIDTPPGGITAGPDGALWFTDQRGNSIGRITTAGVVTNYTDPSIDNPDEITAGPDGALWFTNAGKEAIGRITPP